MNFGGKMPYEYKEHEADVGIVGIGETLEEAMEEGAKGMFAFMVNIEKVKSVKTIKIECDAPDEASLFVEFLNELLSRKDIENMFFSKFDIKKIIKTKENIKLTADVSGEEINLERHEPKTEVKAATYSGMNFEKKNGKFYLQCVIDV